MMEGVVLKADGEKEARKQGRRRAKRGENGKKVRSPRQRPCQLLLQGRNPLRIVEGKGRRKTKGEKFVRSSAGTGILLRQ